MSRLIIGVFLMGSLVIVAGCATLGKGPSDEELIATLLADWKAAFDAQDLDKMMAVYSEDYEGGRSEDKDQLREFLEGAFDQGYLDDAEVDIAEAETTIEGDTATVAPITLSGPPGSMDLQFDLKKEADKVWRIVSSDRY